MKRVSVVILNWNGVDMLRKFIPSVMDNSVGDVYKRQERSWFLQSYR